MCDFHLRPPSAFSVNEDPHTVSKRWQEWTTNFKWFLAASGITNEKRKRRILLYKAGKEITKLYNEIHKKKSSCTLEDLIEELRAHFDGGSNVILARYRFRCCQQQSGESIDAWYRRLCHAAASCDFGDQRESLIRDQIVACCCSEALTKRLLNMPSIDLSGTLRLARTHEVAMRQESIIQRRSHERKASNTAVSRIKSEKILSRQQRYRLRQFRTQKMQLGMCVELNSTTKARLDVNFQQHNREENFELENPFCVADDMHNHATTVAVINRTPVKVLIDSNASHNVIKAETYYNLGGRESDISADHTHVLSLSAQFQFLVVGEANLTVQLNNRSKPVTFIVVRSHYKPIVLGRETSVLFSMLCVGSLNLQKALDTGLSTYTQLATCNQPSTGLCSNPSIVRCNRRLDKTIRAVFMKCKRRTYALKDSLAASSGDVAFSDHSFMKDIIVSQQHFPSVESTRLVSVERNPTGEILSKFSISSTDGKQTPTLSTNHDMRCYSGAKVKKWPWRRF